MREYKIYAEIRGDEPMAFVKEIGEQINNDPELIETTRKINMEFSKAIGEILQNGENAEYMGAMVLRLIFKTPRYSFIKNLEYKGRKYETEIDHLDRRFRLFEIKEEE